MCCRKGMCFAPRHEGSIFSDVSMMLHSSFHPLHLSLGLFFDMVSVLNRLLVLSPPFCRFLDCLTSTYLFCTCFTLFPASQPFLKLVSNLSPHSLPLSCLALLGIFYFLLPLFTLPCHLHLFWPVPSHNRPFQFLKALESQHPTDHLCNNH